MPFKITILVNEGILPDYAVKLHNLLIEKYALSVVIERLPVLKKTNFSSSFFSEPNLLKYSNQTLKKSPVAHENQRSILINLSSKYLNDTKQKHEYIIQSPFFQDHSQHFFPALIKIFGENQSSIEIQIKVGADGKMQTCKKGKFKLIRHSYKQSLETAIRESIQLIIQCTGILISESKIENEQEAIIITSYNVSFFTSIEAFFKISSHLIQKRIEQLFFIEKWNIGKIERDMISVALDSSSKWEVQWMKEKKGRDFFADPFPISNEGETRIYFENYSEKKGMIFHSSNHDRIQNSEINTTAHLSYPYTFSYMGDQYILPEQSENNCIVIYKLDIDTGKAGEAHLLVKDFQGVDPSIIFYNDRWWLFCTDRNEKGADIRLHIFYSENLNGPWMTHKMNPVKSDISSARPAGHLFIKDGRLYRPSQNSTEGYGSSININLVEIISPDEFKEKCINEIRPTRFSGPYNKGIHTISGTEKITFIDGKRKIFKPLKFIPH